MELTDVKYKESEIGVIPVDWEEKLLVDVCTISKERINPITETESYKCVELEHISQETGRLIGFSDTRDLKSQKTVFHKNDVLFGKLRPYLKKFLFADFDGVCTTEIWVLKPNNNIDSKWLYYLVQSNRVLEAANQSTGTKMPRAEWNTVGYTPIPLPPTKSEQTAIATALSDTDALIENLEKLIAKKRNIKQGVMQELLTGKKRLAGFKGKWVTIKIGEVADIHKGNGLSKTKLKQAGKYGCILYGELFTTYKRIIKNAISHTDYEEGVYSKAGDILMPGSTTTTGIDLAIASAVLKDNILLGGDINVIRPKTASINSIFLAYYITEVLKHKILELTQGITIIHLYGKDLKTLEIAIPEISEQDAIGKILVDIDEELSGLENQMNKYQLIKQGMMQKLLTGKIRLV